MSDSETAGARATRPLEACENTGTCETWQEKDARVGLIRGGALGDFVLTLPLVRALQSRVPAGRLILVGSPATARLAGPQIDCIDAETGDWPRLFASSASDEVHRRFSECRLLVACVAGGPSALSARYAHNLRSLCPNLRVTDPLPEPGQNRHMTSRLLDAVRQPGSSALAPQEPRIPVPARDKARELIVLHPGSGGRDKCWSADRFASLNERLEALGHRVVVLWGPVEEARRNEFPESLQKARLSPATPWDLACHLSGARLYIGNDSGPGHVAAAVGCPTLSLFGPTDPALWRPFGRRARVLQAPDGDLSKLSVDAVEEAAVDALQ